MSSEIARCHVSVKGQPRWHQAQDSGVTIPQIISLLGASTSPSQSQGVGLDHHYGSFELQELIDPNITEGPVAGSLSPESVHSQGALRHTCICIACFITSIVISALLSFLNKEIYFIKDMGFAVPVQNTTQRLNMYYSL